MHNQFARSSARWPIRAMAFAIAISAALLGSVYSQPPEPKYDADELADRQAAIAAALKAGAIFTRDSSGSRSKSTKSRS